MGYNILLVADDRETKELLMLHLNSNGFTVDIVQCLLWASEDKFDSDRYDDEKPQRI